MLKKLRRKLFTLFVLCAALMAVSFPPAASANTGVFCMPAPVEYDCASGWICCTEYDSNCLCA
jgi:hypothetical protein